MPIRITAGLDTDMYRIRNGRIYCPNAFNAATIFKEWADMRSLAQNL